MVHRARRWSTACLMVLLACTAAPHALNQQALRVAPDARGIRAFRLNEEHLHKLRKIAESLSRGFQPTPERPRADAAMFTVLSMSLAFNEPFSDRTVGEMVRTIESGHADLHAALRAAEFATADYVLTQITLLLTVPVVASERAGRSKVPATDTAADNVTFVRRHWTEVDGILSELGAATGRRDK